MVYLPPGVESCGAATGDPLFLFMVFQDRGDRGPRTILKISDNISAATIRNEMELRAVFMPSPIYSLLSSS